MTDIALTFVNHVLASGPIPKIVRVCRSVCANFGLGALGEIERPSRLGAVASD
jgi:hypothetical protein